MNRTTIRITPSLLQQAKLYANQKNISLQQVVNWSLEYFFDMTDKKNFMRTHDQSVDQKWATFKLGKTADKLFVDKDFIYGTPAK